MSGKTITISGQDYFSEKSSHIEPRGITAFGIFIESRYGKCYEIDEMIQFAALVAMVSCEHLVKRCFYDSKGCAVSIETECPSDSIPGLAILLSAKRCFNWIIFNDTTYIRDEEWDDRSAGLTEDQKGKERYIAERWSKP